MSLPEINIVDAKETFSDLITRVSHNKERIVITRRGKELAVLIPMDDLNLLLTAQQKAVLEEATHALQEARQQGTLSFDSFKNSLG